MKRIVAFGLCLCLLLCGCGQQAQETQPASTAAPTTQETTVPTTAPQTEPTTAPTTEPVTEPATEPTEPSTEPTEPPVELNYQHPITGEMLAEPMENRPVAVVINNTSVAQPLHGIGDADVLFEIMAEGGGTITRCLAIYSDIENAGTIGSIRSARTYLIDLARAYWAVLVHCGGSEYALEELKTSRYNTINEFYNGAYFYRDQKRLDEGYSREHSLFSTGKDLAAAIATHSFDMVNEGGADYGMTFSEDLVLNGETCNEVSLYFYKGGKCTTMTYDAQAGVYYGMQKWKRDGEYAMYHSFSDANTGEKVPYENVFILRAYTTSDGYWMFAELTGEGTGYFACNGQIVEITWKRDRLRDPFHYYLKDGTPLTVGVGKTYVGVIPNQSPVEYE